MRHYVFSFGIDGEPSAETLAEIESAITSAVKRNAGAHGVETIGLVELPGDLPDDLPSDDDPADWSAENA